MKVGHHSARLAENRKLFTKIDDRVYVGPQGPDLSVFIEEACELDILRRCNLEKYDSRRTTRLKLRNFFILRPHFERAEATAKTNLQNSITDVLELTEEGIQYVTSSDFVNEVAYELILRCGGGNYRGHVSGSNCVRVPLRDGWCSGIGQCEDGCNFSKERDKRCRLEHMCNFTVSITATLLDIRDGRRRIFVQGDHGYPRSQDWIPPTMHRPTVRIRENAVKTGVSIKGPSASNILSQLVNSPSGKLSRSYIPRSVFYKSVENHRRGKFQFVCSF
jgi:hypothetical protein